TEVGCIRDPTRRSDGVRDGAAVTPARPRILCTHIALQGGRRDCVAGTIRPHERLRGCIAGPVDSNRKSRRICLNRYRNKSEGCGHPEWNKDSALRICQIKRTQLRRQRVNNKWIRLSAGNSNYREKVRVAGAVTSRNYAV